MQPSGDHQMQRQPKIIFESKDDAFPQPPEGGDFSSLHAMNGRHRGAQQKRAGDAHLLQRLAHEATLQGLEVDCDIRQLRHAARLSEAEAKRSVTSKARLTASQRAGKDAGAPSDAQAVIK